MIQEKSGSSRAGAAPHGAAFPIKIIIAPHWKCRESAGKWVLSRTGEHAREDF
jgi:hypothetical protein